MAKPLVIHDVTIIDGAGGPPCSGMSARFRADGIVLEHGHGSSTIAESSVWCDDDPAPQHCSGTC